jgi:hypothetical protein
MKRIAKKTRKMRWAKYRQDNYDFHGNKILVSHVSHIAGSSISFSIHIL